MHSNALSTFLDLQKPGLYGQSRLPCDMPSSRQHATWQLVETAASEVVGDDDVGDSVKNKLDIGGVGGARLVAVDLLHRTLVLRLKLQLDVGSRLLVHCWACKAVTSRTRSEMCSIRTWRRGSVVRTSVSDWRTFLIYA